MVTKRNRWSKELKKDQNAYRSTYSCSMASSVGKSHVKAGSFTLPLSEKAKLVKNNFLVLKEII